MESEAVVYNYRLTSNIISNRGTLYFHIPKDIAHAWGLKDKDIVEVTIVKGFPKKEREKKS